MRRRLLVVLGGAALLGAAIAACASEHAGVNVTSAPTGDGGGSDGPLPEASGPCSNNDVLPCSRMAFAEGSPSRLFVVNVPNANGYGQGPYPAPVLATHVGSEEMPSFDRTGRTLAYVRIEEGARSIRTVGIDGQGDRLVVVCGGACELPYFAADDSIWFTDRLASGVAMPMHAEGGVATSPPWATEISGCIMRSIRPTLERDGIVLSLVAGPDSADAGSSDDAGDAGSDASTRPAACPNDGPSIVLARLDATTLPPRKLLVFKGAKRVGALDFVTQATASTATSILYAIADNAERTDPGFLTALGDGEIIARYRDGYDALDLAAATTEKTPYFIGRKRGDPQEPGYSQYWLVGQGQSLVTLRSSGSVYSKTLGPPAWAPYSP
jgi:hypothetical protein